MPVTAKMTAIVIMKAMMRKKQRNQGDHMTYNSSFFSGMNGIFKDKNGNDNQNPKKIRKKGKSLLDQVVGIFNDDEPREVIHSVIISNIKPTHCQ